MSVILERLEAKMNLIYVVLFLIVFILMLSIIDGKGIGVAKLKQITNGVGILDMEPGYSVEKAYKILDELGNEGRAYYLKRILPMDFIFPLTYMMFYASFILFLLKLIHPRNELIHSIILVPILAAIFDYLENLTIIRLLLCFPQKHIISAKIANVFTISKLVCIYLSIAVIIILILSNLFIWARTKFI